MTEGLLTVTIWGKKNSIKRGKVQPCFPRYCTIALLLILAILAGLCIGATAKAAQVTLRGSKIMESDIVGYRIYYGNGCRAYNWFVDVGNVTKYTMTGLADGSTYYFAATAYNTSNIESGYSTEVSYRGCTYSISPTTVSIGQQGGSGTLKVTTQTGCPWISSSGASWFTITSGNQGTGSGTVSYSVTSNTSSSIRTVASTIAGKLFTVSQASAVSGSTTASTATKTQVILEANYSVDIKNNGTKYYHDGSDWVGRSSSGILRKATRWNIASIDPSRNIESIEVRFYTEKKVGDPGVLSINRYGLSRGEDNPQSDSGSVAYGKIAGGQYASLPEPSSGSWTGWINLGRTAASDIAWCRANGKSTWSIGVKASSTVESSTSVRHVDFSEDNETNDAELRITFL
jgi:hypothetical protein